MKVLSASEIEQFIELGYVVIREAFPREISREVLPWVWEQMNLKPDDPAGWKQAMVHVRKFFVGGAFEGVYTPRLRGAVDDLLGEGRWQVPNRSGWWPVRFPGFESKPWKPPESGWHIDGIQFHHHINAPDQGLLGILIFSDIEPGDGGTAISLRSHREAARILAKSEPTGLTPGEFSNQVAALPRPEVLEITGRIGDVALMHPFMLHSASANTGSKVRIVTNKCFPLHEPMRLDRPVESDHSPVEEAIRRALRETPARV